MKAIEILKVLFTVLSITSTAILAYQLFLVLSTFLIKEKKKPKVEITKYNKFAIIIAARNEEMVIGNLIDSLMQQNYPRELYDVIVIADNCTDKTALIAAQHGAQVVERENLRERGKGYALNWFFDLLGKEGIKQYDAFCIFDADNLADEDYLAAMNCHINAGDKILQGNRETMNPSDTWVSGSYAIYFWTIIKIFMKARQKLGLSGTVGGTGFAFTSDLIQETGWRTTTLTEDIEFSLQQILKGYEVVPAYDAVFYDEQPTTFRQSVRQRYRWTLGSIQCMEKFIGAYLKGVFKGSLKQRFICFDQVLSLVSVPCTAVFAVNAAIGITLQSFGKIAWYSLLFQELLAVLGTFVIIFLSGLIIVLLCKKPVKLVKKGLFGFPLFMMSWLYINLGAIFYRNTTWKPIEHTNKASLRELKKQLATKPIE
jgi:cellulose synthase/poly-beta-1,6-N-acetylglucosamine synthase-like glycosyltransferase